MGVGWVVVLALGCRGNDSPSSSQRRVDRGGTQPIPLQQGEAQRGAVDDYAVARRAFRTKLLREQPSPQPGGQVVLADDARQVTFDAAGRKLRAWISPESKSKRPAVLFLHGGYAFGADDWTMTKPFRDAGYIAMTPILRGENGTSGSFSLYYDEVDDVLAAAETLAKRPDVDPARIYVTGHSAGGTLAMLAALASTRFRAAASLSGVADSTIQADDEMLITFDASNIDEFRMRSALVFAASFKCPARLYFGSGESWPGASTTETARRAKAAGIDVEAVTVDGDHFTMIDAAIPLAIAFFDQQR